MCAPQLSPEDLDNDLISELSVNDMDQHDLGKVGNALADCMLKILGQHNEYLGNEDHSMPAQYWQGYSPFQIVRDTGLGFTRSPIIDKL